MQKFPFKIIVSIHLFITFHEIALLIYFQYR